MGRTRRSEYPDHRHNNTTTRPDRDARFLLAGMAVLGRHVCTVKKPTFPFTHLKIQKTITLPFPHQFKKNKNLCDPYKM